jgi:hypothetical protein
MTVSGKGTPSIMSRCRVNDPKHGVATKRRIAASVPTVEDCCRKDYNALLCKVIGGTSPCSPTSSENDSLRSNIVKVWSKSKAWVV